MQRPGASASPSWDRHQLARCNTGSMRRPLSVAMTMTQNWQRIPGGIAVSTNALAQALVDAGERQPARSVRVTGVVPRGRPPEPPWVPPVEVRALPLPLPLLYDAWDLARWPRVTSVTEPVDLVHLTVPIAVPRERVPLVATVHDLLPLTMPESFTRRGRRLMQRGLHRIRNEADAVIVLSEIGRHECVRHGFDPSRLHLVPWGVETPAPMSEKTVAEFRVRAGLEDPFLLFVGTAEPRKGLGVLVEAFEILDDPDLTLVIVGPDGWGGVGDELRRSAQRLAPRVRFEGFVPDSELALYRRAAALCCMPSQAEGFGLPVLEAMAAGLPVVTTEHTPMADMAGDAALCVPFGKPAALASAVEAVLTDPALAEEMSRIGLSRAASFTWERTAAGVVDVYEEVMS